jgi:hypothetical protein
MRTLRPPPAWTIILLLFAISQHARADTRTYRNPSFEGYRLNYCDVSGAHCGGPIASDWCRAQGFERASDWVIAERIGESAPTLTLTGGQVCDRGGCDGFALITCARAERAFRGPNLGTMGRSTVLTPDRRTTESPVSTVEYQLLVPGCHQREPGVLMCESLHDYQHCRTLLASGVVLGCRAGLAFDGDIADAEAASPGSFDLTVRSGAAATVYRGRRGEGKAKGDVRYRVEFATPAGNEICLQRDRYVYYPSGPHGGMSTIDDTAECGEPVSGRFAPHEDDLLHAYDLCEAKQAWGSHIESSAELLVAALYYLAPRETSSVGTGTHVVAPYVTVRGALKVDCHR